MYFKKQNLASLHYSWIGRDEHIYRGDPSRRIFDRNNGYQVLFIINVCASFKDLFLQHDGNLIEQKIQTELPYEIKSEKSVLNWLKEKVFAF